MRQPKNDAFFGVFSDAENRVRPVETGRTPETAPVSVPFFSKKNGCERPAT